MSGNRPQRRPPMPAPMAQMLADLHRDGAGPKAILVKLNRAFVSTPTTMNAVKTRLTRLRQADARRQSREEWVNRWEPNHIAILIRAYRLGARPDAKLAEATALLKEMRGLLDLMCIDAIPPPLAPDLAQDVAAVMELLRCESPDDAVCRQIGQLVIGKKVTALPVTLSI